jgi:hypothetical protein|tara:strand:- start:1670 stop:1939 length:270 start_codon:yes stop_codon:yes gene_type:complete
MWGSNGVIQYDSNSATWNQVDFYQVNANSSNTRTFNGLLNKEIKVALLFIDPPLITRKAISHSVTLSNSSRTITVGGGTENMYVLVLMR